MVVCSCNGSATIRDTLEHMGRLDYPDFEVIVIDDGSGDATASIAARYPVRLVSTPNRGLSAVRNLGMQEATGEIVAYIDDDAYPDPDWLTHLSWALVHGSHAGVGGPNLPPPGDGPIAEAVSRAPGGPCHVLVSDTEAEHIPGCNMAFWKRDLFAVSGFDPVFRSAGDDVDLCWRLLESGRTLCFSPAAVVWHHRRNSLRAYWKQQIGYGRAEALLERKWPERYNVAGHVAWTGRIYGVGLTEALFRRRNLVYHGEWGTAPFQSMYQQGPTTLGSVTLMPEWLLIVVILGLVSLVGVLWSPAAAVSPLFGLALCATLLQAWRSTKDPRWSPRKDWLEGLRLRALTALLHLVQPGARLYGRTLHGLTPWRRRGILGHLSRWRHERAFWSERWEDPVQRLGRIEDSLRESGAVVRRGGPWARFDLEMRGGLLGAARLRVGLEEHGSGRQLVRWRSWTRLSPMGGSLAGLFGVAGGLASLQGAWAAGLILLAASLGLLLKSLRDAAGALAAVDRAIGDTSEAGGVEIRPGAGLLGRGAAALEANDVR